ncbi:MAG: hypothetical protein ACFFG0_07820 [Candidatus Thorarchaeota archaeon]
MNNNNYIVICTECYERYKSLNDSNLRKVKNGDLLQNICKCGNSKFKIFEKRE